MARRDERPGCEVLTSRLGRRFVALFVGCALLPLAAFAGVALIEASAQLGRDAERGLHLATKSAGMGLASRIARLAADLDVARALLIGAACDRQGACDLLDTRLRAQYRSVYIDDGGVPDVKFGERPRPLPALSPREAAHLATGKPLLRVVRVGSAPGDVFLTLSCQLADAEAPRLVAELHAGKVFDAEELRAGGAEVLVYDGAGGSVFSSTTELPDAGPLQRALAQQPASGTFEWQLNGSSHLARYWRMFLQPRFGNDLLLVQSRARAGVLAPLHGFQMWFTTTALLALLLVTTASLVLIRRTLTPIAELRAATQRVAAGDFSARVPEHSRDELGDLARSFNVMTAELLESIRRREATEKQLVAARDDALAAVRAKADFLTNVSHELRTPLTSILSSAEILRDYAGEGPVTRTEFAGMIADRAQHLTALIDQVLALTSGGDLELAEVDVACTIRESVDRLGPAARARIRLDLPDRLPAVTGAHESLVQLWGHLLGNAIKFSPPGSPVTLRADAVGDGHLAITVEDRGAGIAASDLERIFEPFCQVGRDIHTAKARGVGLGLTLARHIADQHGGTLEVRSTLGRGSTFVVALPVARAAPVPVAAGAV